MKTESLHDLTNAQILKNITHLVTCDRRCTVKLIAHLAEMERRSLHLELGFRSLFEYCQRELQLEESQIWLRLQVAKRCNEFPRLLHELASGSLSLTVCGRLAAHLTKDNHAQLLNDCRGMTGAEVREFLVGIKPKPEVTGGIRKAPAVKSAARMVSEQRKGLFADGTPAKNDQASPTPVSKRPKIQPATPERYNLSVSIGKETKKKLDRLASVLGKDNAAQNLEAILDLALEAALDKKDPMRKAERAEQRQQRNKRLAPEKAIVKERLSRSRYVAAADDRAVFKLADYQCEFVSYDGRRCTQRHHLNIDHVVPFARNGSNAAANLQVLCRAHNLYKAKQDFGAQFVERKIAERKRAGREMPDAQSAGHDGGASAGDGAAKRWAYTRY